MSERTDFFASGSKSATPAAAPKTRNDFFAGNVDIDADVGVPEKPTPAVFSQPYGYYDPAVQRLVAPERMASSFGQGAGQFVSDLAADPMASIRAIPTAINRGVVDLAGLPMDTATSAADLIGAGYGTVASMVTGRPAGEFFEPYDRTQVPLTGDWFAKQLDESPGGNVTQLQDPENSAARLIYGAGRALPGAMTGRQLLAGAAGGGAATVASEMGADPATQAIAGLAGGRAAEPEVQPKSRAQRALDEAAAAQSTGAAGAAVDLQKLSPDLRAAVEKATEITGGAINPDVLARRIQADSLPVRVQLSEGQALGDARTISEERNARGKLPGVAERFEEQNKALVENTRAFRDEAGQDVFSTNHVEHADTIIARYQKIDDAANAEIASNYKALKDAAGGKFPVDAKALFTDAENTLGSELLLEHAKDLPEMRTLKGLAEKGEMTFEQFEKLRTNLARTQRSSSDGNMRAAAGVIRDAMERLPLAESAATLKPLADKARASARARFEALDADPAYKAAVNGTTQPDKFVQKFLINGNRDAVAKLAEAMKGDETAMQTVRVASLDHLRQAAGIDSGYNGKFSQAGYNKALRGLEPKILSLLGPELAEKVQTLGDVARYTQFQPEGSFVNNSNTLVAQTKEHVANAAEGIANLKAGGVPVGTWVRKNITDRQGKKAAEQMFAPGAGLTKLKDLPKKKPSTEKKP